MLSCTTYIILFSVHLRLTLVLALFLFIFIGTLKKIIFVVNLVPTLKQQLIKHINGKYKANKH